MVTIELDEMGLSELDACDARSVEGGIAGALVAFGVGVAVAYWLLHGTGKV